MARWGLCCLGLVLGISLGVEENSALGCFGSSDNADVRRFLDLYCVACHNTDDRAAGLTLDREAAVRPEENPKVWEGVLRKLLARQMPPAGEVRPSAEAYDRVASEIAGVLDREAIKNPRPGRTATLRRLNRTEYQNAIRDLLGLEIDATALLPGDESSHGFDNITVADLSPTLLDRYISAAEKISRLAMGGAGRSPGGETFRVRADLTQEEHIEGLPLGTRGGTLIPMTFPQDGEYEFQVRLARDRNEHVEGLRQPHQMILVIDRERRGSWTVNPPRSERDHQTADTHLKIRLRVPAGLHQVGVTFLKNPTLLLETKRQPYQAHYNMHRHPRLSPAVYQVSMTGPYETTGRGDTPSRRRIVGTEAVTKANEDQRAQQILGRLARRAFRKPLSETDLEVPLRFYREGRAESGFDAGIESALAAILVNPQFLFRIEADPTGVSPKSAYRISDVELASRLSFFIWSSLPDETLLDLAEKKELHRPDVIRAQVLRMLADDRSRNLSSNFAGQWLHLRNLDSITPDLRLFPDFDDNLRQAFRNETELLFQEVAREDRSVVDLLHSDHTYLNERLAKHYGIPHIQGSHFRRVKLSESDPRGGLLRQGSVLTVTSYATRTSPVIRGKWVLENILGTPPPPPPANVPALKDNTVSATLSVRERLAEHRANVACAGCHALMDPVGFALENYDAVGRWRDVEEGRPVDSDGGLPDGNRFVGVDGLERALLKRPELFVSTMTEKLLTFALGRVVDHNDAPAIRQVVRDARPGGYKLSDLIVGIAQSTPFQWRMAE